MPDSLIEALGATTGIVCITGAGGKKTTLQRILAAHPGRVGVTATVMSTLPDRDAVDARHIAAAPALAAVIPDLAARHRRVAFAAPGHKPGRVAGLAPEMVAALHERSGFDATLVKADGARMRGIKAPRPDEPVIVPGCRTVLSVVSAAVIGQPLDERIAHRVERLCECLDIEPGTRLTAAHVGQLLSHRRGGRQHLGGARHIALINQVDDAGRRREAHQAGLQALASAHPPARVVLASMTAPDPLVDVVEPPPLAAD